MALYNISENMTIVTDLLPLANTMSNNLLGLGIFLIVSLGTFVLTSSFDKKSSLISSSFISMITGLFLYHLNLLSGAITVIPVIIFAFVTIISLVNKDRLGA